MYQKINTLTNVINVPRSIEQFGQKFLILTIVTCMCVHAEWVKIGILCLWNLFDFHSQNGDMALFISLIRLYTKPLHNNAQVECHMCTCT